MDDVINRKMEAHKAVPDKAQNSKTGGGNGGGSTESPGLMALVTGGTTMQEDHDRQHRRH
jgi:hypothetical protein